MSSPKLSILATGLLVLLVLVYANHFDNGFYFDDIHTIVNNEYIRSLCYVPEYFTNIETFGTMPNNRGYRPVVTLLNAIDYQLAGGALNPVVSHLTTFGWYLVQAAALWLFFYRIFVTAQPGKNLSMVALLTAAFYTFHTANAETVNYIIARSDLFSSLCVVLTLLAYQWPPGRRWHLYLLPLVLGMLCKEVAFMAVPLLGLYHLLFCESATLGEFAHRQGWKKLGRSVLAALPALVIGSVLLYHNLVVMTDTSRLSGGLAHPRWDYFTTQWQVVTHYLFNFVLPIKLSADPDFQVVAGLSLHKVGGFVVIAVMHGLALLATRKLETLPIAFGILWFFICLAPTSTFNPLYQVANDHRTFLPYIGLAMALGWSAWLLWQRVEASCNRTRGMRWLPPVLIASVLLAHGAGVVRRNHIWGSQERLWADTVAKSPRNGRALMNYGLVKMAQGRYEEAQELLSRAHAVLPTWPYTNINLAVLYAAKGQDDLAEQYFRAARYYGRDNPEAYFYYARWLHRKGEIPEALELLREGQRLVPKHVKINALLAELDSHQQDRWNSVRKAQGALDAHPTADGWIDLSLRQMELQDYEGALESCRKALKLQPDNAYAYNNICYANIKLGRLSEAVDAGKKAVQLKPGFELAQNNLRWAQRELAQAGS